MQREHHILRIARRETGLFFSSPMAYIFLGAFLAADVFVFFWIDTFFARDLADVYPLFHWMPLLLIFLVAALTMRMWSEERRSGTLEFLLTQPVAPVEYVLGKFLACMALVAIALLATLPLPITVSFMGRLAWGPVIGGYVGALFLGAAYVAIGLFVSARTDNQLVSLIVTLLLGLALYLIGSSLVTGLAGFGAASVLRLLGSGSRFDSIARGVIDLPDLYYYLSLAGSFLALNVISLERQRWASAGRLRRHRVHYAVTGLVIVNLLAANFWIGSLGDLRIDLTPNHFYSLSGTTRKLLASLRQPLLIHGYFSARTSPYLVPLVPELENFLKEYQAAGKGRVRLQLTDPQTNSRALRQATRDFGIRPVPFEVAGKYQTSVVNSFFNVVVQYGNQYQVLNWHNLIAAKVFGENHIQVGLRDPEYVMTRAVEKVVRAWRSAGNLWSGIREPVTLTGYISPAKALPKKLATLRATLVTVSRKLERKSKGKFTYRLVDPLAGNGAAPAVLAKRYGMEPMTTNPLTGRKFYFYLLLGSGHRHIQLPFPNDFTKSALRHDITSGLRRFAKGFTRTVAVYAPQVRERPYGPPEGPSFELLRRTLAKSMNIEDTTLDSGEIPSDADFLMVLAPESLNKKQLFAIDQFLMRGGTVLLAVSPYRSRLGRNALILTPRKTGLGPWLRHFGITLSRSFVLDSRDARFALPIERTVSGMPLREIALIRYPYFPDIRGAGLDPGSPITSGLSNVTLSWASPIELSAGAGLHRRVSDLLETSSGSWVSNSTDVTPRFGAHGIDGFQPSGKRRSRLVGVMMSGRFTSFFKGKPSPLLPAALTGKTGRKGKGGAPQSRLPYDVITRSPESARLVVIPSSTFLSDQTLSELSAVNRSAYRNSVQFVENIVDWSLGNKSLLALRGRNLFANTLLPMSRRQQEFWEYLNYGLAAGTLVLVWIASLLLRRRRLRLYRLGLGLEEA